MYKAMKIKKSNRRNKHEDIQEAIEWVDKELFLVKILNRIVNWWLG